MLDYNEPFELPLREYFCVWRYPKHRWRIMRTLMRDGRAAAAAALGCAILCAYGLLNLNSMLHAVVGQSFGVACMACWLGLVLLLALAARIPAHIHLVAVLSDRASQIERLCYRYTVDPRTADTASVQMGGPISTLRKDLNAPRYNGQRRERSERLVTDGDRPIGLKRVTQIVQWRSDCTIHNSARTPTVELEQACVQLLYGQLGMQMDSVSVASSTVLTRIALAAVALAIVLWLSWSFGMIGWSMVSGLIGH